MSEDFTLYTQEDVKDEAKALFENSMKAYGMVPNLHAVMAESPQLLDAYQKIGDLFQQTSFNVDELTVIWQTINIEHKCHYCVPAHTAVAHMLEADPEITENLKAGKALSSPKLQALHETTLALTKNRGVISDEQKHAFYVAGYGNQQLLEIVLGLAQKVMSNYTNHLADTPLDEPFKKFA